MSLYPFTIFATNVGDSGVLLPVALVSAAVLWFFHSRRLAWLLLRSVLFAALAIAVLKLWFLSCGAHWFLFISSPSGHACMSAVVYGVLASLLARAQPARVQWVLYGSALLIVTAVAATRVALGVHTLPEVLIGTLVGALAYAWFAVSYARMPPVALDYRIFGVALAASVLLAYGVRLPAESLLRHLARRLGENCALIVPVHRDGPAAPVAPGGV